MYIYIYFSINFLNIHDLRKNNPYRIPSKCLVTPCTSVLLCIDTDPAGRLGILKIPSLVA
jgi:hypothetical protein